ncbi:RNA methyltransferase [soil metagenome]
MTVITSKQNETVKFVRSLQAKKDRQRTSQFAVEGDDFLARARTCGWIPDLLLSTSAASPFRDWAGQDMTVSDAVMAHMSRQANSHGHIAVFTRRLLHQMPQPAEDDVWIGLEEIRDPGNLGTIIRTADAAGAAGVVLIGECCDPFSPECVRATTGSIFAIPLISAEDAFPPAGWPGDIVATAMDAPTDFRRSYRLPALLLMGSEGGGLSPALKACATVSVRIPMTGGAESLNVAIATGIMLYEIRR